MKLNRIQIQIFEKLSKERDLQLNDYIKHYSKEYLDTQRDGIEQLTEAEADMWIHKAYIQSLS